MDFGVDISREWSFTNGDLDIVEGYGNLGQAICNRLNADLETYSMFYARYGGNLWEHMGDLNMPTIHEYIKIEVESIVKQDPRINDAQCTVTKTAHDTIVCDLKIQTKNDDKVRLNLVITPENGVTLESISSMVGEI